MLIGEERRTDAYLEGIMRGRPAGPPTREALHADYPALPRIIFANEVGGRTLGAQRLYRHATRGCMWRFGEGRVQGRGTEKQCGSSGRQKGGARDEFIHFAQPLVKYGCSALTQARHAVIESRVFHVVNGRRNRRVTYQPGGPLATTSANAQLRVGKVRYRTNGTSNCATAASFQRKPPPGRFPAHTVPADGAIGFSRIGDARSSHSR